MLDRKVWDNTKTQNPQNEIQRNNLITDRVLNTECAYILTFQTIKHFTNLKSHSFTLQLQMKQLQESVKVQEQEVTVSVVTCCDTICNQNPVFSVFHCWKYNPLPLFVPKSLSLKKIPLRIRNLRCQFSISEIIHQTTSGVSTTQRNLHSGMQNLI